MSLLQGVLFRNQEKTEACKGPSTHTKGRDTGEISVEINMVNINIYIININRNTRLIYFSF